MGAVSVGALARLVRPIAEINCNSYRELVLTESRSGGEDFAMRFGTVGELCQADDLRCDTVLDLDGDQILNSGCLGPGRGKSQVVLR